MHTLNLRSIPCLADIVVFIYNAEIKSVNLTRPAVLHCLLKFDIHLRTIRAFEGSTLRGQQGFFASACVRYSRALKITSAFTFQAINLNSNLNQLIFTFCNNILVFDVIKPTKSMQNVPAGPAYLARNSIAIENTNI